MSYSITYTDLIRWQKACSVDGALEEEHFSNIRAKEMGIFPVSMFSQLVLKLIWESARINPDFTHVLAPFLYMWCGSLCKVIPFPVLLVFPLFPQMASLEGEVKDLKHRIREYQEEVFQLNQKVKDIECLKEQKEKEQQHLHDQQQVR